MKRYEDLYTYYPHHVLNTNTSFRDFIIIDMSAAALSPLDNSHFNEYRKPHLRNFFEIHIGVIEPITSCFNIGSNEITSKTKHVFFVSPNQTYSLKFDFQEKMKNGAGYIIAFHPSFLLDKKSTFEILDTYRFFSSYSFSQHFFNPEKLEPILQLAKKMFEEYINPKEYTKEIIGGYMTILLNLFNRSLRFENELIASSPSEHIATCFARSIIDDGSNILSVAGYASKLNISTSYLSECIKKATGITPKQIINNHKLIVAKSLLEQKGKSVAEIAYEMNYSEPTNFAKFFKQLTGLTPKQFRKG